MTLHPRRTLLVALLALAGCAGPPPSPAAEAPKVDPRAQAVLDEAARAYKNLPAYSDQGEFSVKMTVKGKERSQTMKRPLAFARPNLINLVEGDGQVRVVSDGKTLTTKLMGKYLQAPAPAHLSLKDLEEERIPKALLASPPGIAGRSILAFLTSDDPAKVLLENSAGASREDARKEDGKTFNAVLIDQEQGPDLRFLFDARSKLLARVEFVFNPKDFPEGSTVPDSVVWTAGEVSTEAPNGKGDTFAFAPAEDSKKVDSLADLLQREAEPDPAEKWVGKPAPDFTLTVLDGPGKTRKVSKADLAGKVVLIDFWATWCGPCMKELPELAKVIESYDKKEAKDVVVIALSEDEGEGADGSRKLVEETLVEKKLQGLTAGSVGKVALDPAGEIGSAFAVSGLPTVMILDAKGVVRSVHVGYDPDIRAVLTREIDALLDGKAEKAGD